jgi:hypothetical protein
MTKTSVRILPFRLCSVAVALGTEKLEYLLRYELLEAFLARERQKLLHMLGADEKWIEHSVDLIRG